MYRLVLVVATAGILSSGCSEIECTGEGGATVCTGDDRPATIEYVTTTILRPSCANAQCHSSLKNQSEFRFDTVEHVQGSIIKQNVLADPDDDETLIDIITFDPELSQLFLVLTRETLPDGSLPRMPYDQPMNGADLALIKRWIEGGADGLVIP